MKLVRWLGVGLGVITLAIVLAFGSIAAIARFTDGPLGPFQGGALRNGPLVTDPVRDWGFVESVMEVELQLIEPPRSRTTWILFHDGSAYIPCGFPNMRFWKKWPYQAQRDGRAIVRIAGRRYRVDLVRVEDPALEQALIETFRHKYEIAGEYESETWYFRLE